MTVPQFGTVKYFHKDHLGSSSVITDATGSLLEQKRYVPYGGQRGEGSGITATAYKFTDQEHDGEIGLYNYDARLYDPVIGRFISPDGITPDWYDPQMLNRYAYCRNNPIKYVDPSGHIAVFPSDSDIRDDLGIPEFDPTIPLIGVELMAAEFGVIGPPRGFGAGAGNGGGGLRRVVREIKKAVKGIFKRTTQSGGVSVEAASVESVASKSAKIPGEPTTKLYHGGNLKGGKVQPKKFSTTTDPAHAAKYAEAHGGKVTEFEVPTRRLYELEGKGAEQLIDNLQGTTSTAKEWRFYGESAAELNNYMK